ncbi:MAG TPA: hypothetical protein VE978_01145 [Chitinophagales bacterium]|nr:hypothetical protein [Chitinophagales bacterium]
MKNILIPLFFTLGSVLGSCKNDKKVTPEVQIPPDTTSTSNFSSNEKTFKGLFVVGKNILSFRECDHPEKDFGVIDSTGKMKDLYKALFLHSPAFPYEYVYVEVKGQVSAAPDADVRRGFDSVLTVEEVLTFEQKNYQNSCIPYDFWAIGKDWSLQISEKEDMMIMKDFSAMKVYVFKYFPPKNQNDEVLTYASNNYAAGVAIKAVIRKEACSEDSSQSAFQYSARVIINGKVFQGCAIQGIATQ